MNINMRVHGIHAPDWIRCACGSAASTNYDIQRAAEREAQRIATRRLASRRSLSVYFCICIEGVEVTHFPVDVLRNNPRAMSMGDAPYCAMAYAGRGGAIETFGRRGPRLLRAARRIARLHRRLLRDEAFCARVIAERISQRMCLTPGCSGVAVATDYLSRGRDEVKPWAPTAATPTT